MIMLQCLLRNKNVFYCNSINEEDWDFDGEQWFRQWKHIDYIR